MARFTRWLRSNADGVVVVVLVVVSGSLEWLNVLNVSQVSGAILLVLGFIAVSLMRDRHRTDAYLDQYLRETRTARILTWNDVTRALAEARSHTDLWKFKGGTGTYLRAATLPDCVELARMERRPLQFQIEIIDPSDMAVCSFYTQFRTSLSTQPDGTGEPWNAHRTRKEAYATIVAAAWYLQHYGAFLRLDLAVSPVASRLRYDLSSRYVIITQEDPATPALMFEKPSPHYNEYSGELDYAFRQAHRIPMDRATELSDVPTVDEARCLFQALGVDAHGLTDDDVADVIERAIRPRRPYP